MSTCKVIREGPEGGGDEETPLFKPVIPPAAVAPLNQSNNVLLVFRLHEMRQCENVNIALAFLCLAYCGTNVALIITNYVDSQYDDPEDKPVPEKWFHLVEFWGTFAFAIVECLSLIFTPKSMINLYDNPLLLRLILFFNIVVATIPALLISFNYEYFEVISHQIEYLNELTMSFVDCVLLMSLSQLEGTSGQLVCVALGIAVIQLLVYNAMGRDENGDMIGEVPAHYLEFAFEIISSIIVFWFCVDNKFLCGKEIGDILYGTHKDCRICRASFTEYTETYRIAKSNEVAAALSGNGTASKTIDYGSAEVRGRMKDCGVM